jgi:hypothetical protein
MTDARDDGVNYEEDDVSETLICIPSAGRSTRQITLRHLREFKLLGRTAIFVPEVEHRRYVMELGQDLLIIPVPDAVSGIGNTRAWILTEYAREAHVDRILMIDDDMDFCYRPDVKLPKLEIVETEERMLDMLGRLDRWMDEGFVHVGVSARQGNQNKYYDENKVYGLHEYRDATRMMNMYQYDVRALAGLPIKWGRVPVMEDFDLTLQLLRLGRANRVLFEYCWNQRDSGATGGCSTYRTPEMQAEAASKLAQLHPGFVKLVTKKSKDTSTAWRGMKERVDVMVYWRDAIDSARVTS